MSGRTLHPTLRQPQRLHTMASCDKSHTSLQTRQRPVRAIPYRAVNGTATDVAL